MSDDGAAVATGVFGGLTCVCLVCLFVLGLPLLLAGIVMLAFFPTASATIKTVAIVFVVIASLMVGGGVLFAILTCVCATKSSNTRPQRTQTNVIVSPTVVAPPAVIFTTGVNPQPPGYAPPPGEGQHQFYHPNTPLQPPPYQANTSSAPPPYYDYHPATYSTDQPPPYNPQHTENTRPIPHAPKPVFT